MFINREFVFINREFVFINPKFVFINRELVFKLGVRTYKLGVLIYKWRVRIYKSRVRIYKSRVCIYKSGVRTYNLEIFHFEISYGTFPSMINPSWINMVDHGYKPFVEKLNVFDKEMYFRFYTICSHISSCSRHIIFTLTKTKMQQVAYCWSTRFHNVTNQTFIMKHRSVTQNGVSEELP